MTHDDEKPRARTRRTEGDASQIIRLMAKDLGLRGARKKTGSDVERRIEREKMSPWFIPVGMRCYSPSFVAEMRVAIELYEPVLRFSAIGGCVARSAVLGPTSKDVRSPGEVRRVKTYTLMLNPSFKLLTASDDETLTQLVAATRWADYRGLR